MIHAFVLGVFVALSAALPAGRAAAEEWRRLLDPVGLEALAAAGPVRILDIRAPAGADSYAAGHVPGAVSAPYDSWRGPKENPGRPLSDEALTERLRSAGVDGETPVVIVHQGADQTDFGAAARVYWTLKSAGLDRLAILNGGFAAWKAAGLPVSTAPAAPPRTAITASLSSRWMATRADVEAAVAGGTGAVLVDARPHEFFIGAKKHDAAKESGTIEGAINLVHDQWFAPAQTTLSAPAAAVERARALAAKADGAPIVSFCNTGHWAATNWFALSEIAGVENVKLYPESVVGWSIAGYPLVLGN
jgi:thiosulfate/3-mercaptopyruvate sulfurtransferase